MSFIEKIFLKNFRVFDEGFEIKLKPITFLTGPNSSGKSSVLKSILLLKSNTASSLQVLDFTGDKHNLGTFDNTINKKCTEKDLISIGLTTILNNATPFSMSLYKEPVTTRRSVYYILREEAGEESESIKILLHFRKNDRSGKLAKLEFFVKEEEKPVIVLTLTQDDTQNHELDINQNTLVKNDFLNEAFLNFRMVKDRKKIKTPKSTINTLKKYVMPSKFKLQDGNKEEFYDEPILIFSLLYKQFLNDTFKQNIDTKTLHSFFLRQPIKQILQDFSSILENTEYIEAVRANTKRIYTNDSQGTGFNELILDYNARDINESNKKFIDKWLKKFDIADTILFENIEGVATTVYLLKEDKKIALADLGYGITQFLPILLKIALEYPIVPKEEASVVKKLILLEEPETNLHPKLQSLLADFFVDVIKTFEVRLIIETHSEYLIRKMQILVGDSILKKEDSNIYYFCEDGYNTGDRISEISFLDNGALDKEFGQGFYDEATNLKFELLKRKAL